MASGCGRCGGKSWSALGKSEQKDRCGSAVSQPAFGEVTRADRMVGCSSEVFKDHTTCTLLVWESRYLTVMSSFLVYAAGKSCMPGSSAQKRFQGHIAHGRLLLVSVSQRRTNVC